MFFYLCTCLSLLLPSRAFPGTKLLFMSRILSLIRPKMPLKKTTLPTSLVHEEEAEEERNRGMSVLDLPDLALDNILERLPPAELLSMAGVCTSLRNRCLSDRLWEGHMTQKWGKLMGTASSRGWHSYIAAAKGQSGVSASAATAVARRRGRWVFLLRLLSWVWPFSWFILRLSNRSGEGRPSRRNSSPVDSVASWYIALETGRFSFPAQVYNRENGHVGFILSCYDADLSYDPPTDSFMARYPSHGRRAAAIENGVPWERLRAPPMDTSPRDLHISNCLSDLQPGDHIEIQWRRNKEFPYGWWYGVVGHLESCDKSENLCRCQDCDSVVLEFNQFAQGSRWRQTSISRKESREEGNEADGFYGGIRKLSSSEEISTWKRFWPTGDFQY